MYTRGSTTSQRVKSLTQFLESATLEQKKTVKAIFATIKKKYPSLELAIAWNKPMLKKGDDYVFGLSLTKSYILIAPFRAEVIQAQSKRLEGYKVNKKTIQVPSDWKVDSALLNGLIKDCLASIAVDKKKAKKSPKR